MLGLRSLIFAPLGLTFGLFDITPWLFPIPLTVLVIAAGTNTWALSKLDPIALIERRAYG